MTVQDNIDQHNRRKHTELDNIFQDGEHAAYQEPPLYSAKAIDIVKYALAIGDPLQPDVVPDWLRALLKGQYRNVW